LVDKIIDRSKTIRSVFKNIIFQLMLMIITTWRTLSVDVTI